MRVIRVAGFVILLGAAVFVTFMMAPDEVDIRDTAQFDRLIEQALDDFESNEALSDSAPQQQVVNGWVARDLLSVMASQLNTVIEASTPVAEDERPTFLLLILVAAVAWHGMTAREPTASRPRAEMPSDAPVRTSEATTEPGVSEAPTSTDE